MIAHTDPVSHGLLAAAAVGVVLWSLRERRAIDRHTGAVAVGASATLAALSPWVESAAAATYTGHMLQHLVLVLVAAPAVAWGVRRRVRSRHRARLTLDARRRARRCAHLALALSFPIALLATHLTDWYEAALHHRAVHDLEHVAYLASAVGLWALVFERVAGATAARIVAAFATIVATAFVGIVLTTSSMPLVDAYELRLGRVAAVADQRRAGALMWTSGMLLVLPLLVSTFWGWAAGEQQRQQRLERLTDRATGGADEPSLVRNP